MPILELTVPVWKEVQVMQAVPVRKEVITLTMPK
jgi:hypothetical protein